jgi:hypothetical protein
VASRSRLAGAIRLRRGEANLYASFLGSVPAAESDEAFARAVEAIG